MSIGTGLAVIGVCAVPVAAMFARDVRGSGFIASLIFAGIAIYLLVAHG